MVLLPLLFMRHEQDAQLGSISKIIGDFLALYQRAKPDLAITFVDPDENPQRAQAAGVQLNGEMVVEFNGRTGTSGNIQRTGADQRTDAPGARWRETDNRVDRTRRAQAR